MTIYLKSIHKNRYGSNNKPELKIEMTTEKQPEHGNVTRLENLPNLINVIDFYSRCLSTQIMNTAAIPITTTLIENSLRHVTQRRPRN